MKPNRFFKAVIAAIVLCGAAGKPAAAVKKQGPDKPNIVFIYVDDWGWTDLSHAGSAYYETPNIDRLAATGIRFTQAYSIGPNCAPSRASLMTGLYPPRHGIYTVGTAERGDSTLRKLVPVKNNTVLNPRFVTIAEELKNAGYATSLIGKWQLGEKAGGADASSQGFDHVIAGTPGTASYFYPYIYGGQKKLHRGLEKGEEGEYLTDRLTDEGIAFVESAKDRPFFLYLSYFAVHTPVQAKAGITEKYRVKQGNEYHNKPEYAAMIESADQGVGKLWDRLGQLNLLDNTLIVFYSDNGGMGANTANYPLRGSKGMLYEGGIRVPLIFNWKGKISPAVTDTKVIGVDFYPSFLELAGIQKPLNKRKPDGVSFIPALTGGKLPERDLFWHFPAYLEAYKGDKRESGPFRTAPVSVIRSGQYKLLEFYEDGKLELYDLKADLGETKDIAKTNSSKTKELHRKLTEWRKNVQAPAPEKPNPYYKGAAASGK